MTTFVTSTGMNANIQHEDQGLDASANAASTLDSTDDVTSLSGAADGAVSYSNEDTALHADADLAHGLDGAAAGAGDEISGGLSASADGALSVSDDDSWASFDGALDGWLDAMGDVFAQFSASLSAMVGL